MNKEIIKAFLNSSEGKIAIVLELVVIIFILFSPFGILNTIIPILFWFIGIKQSYYIATFAQNFCSLKKIESKEVN